jgi:hypothetical protein
MSLLLMFLESTKYLNEFMISEQHVSKSWYQVTFYSAGILTKCLTTFCGQRNKLAICQRYTKLCFDIDLMKWYVSGTKTRIYTGLFTVEFLRKYNVMQHKIQFKIAPRFKVCFFFIINCQSVVRFETLTFEIVTDCHIWQLNLN